MFPGSDQGQELVLHTLEQIPEEERLKIDKLMFHPSLFTSLTLLFFILLFFSYLFFILLLFSHLFFICMFFIHLFFIHRFSTDLFFMHLNLRNLCSQDLKGGCKEEARKAAKVSNLRNWGGRQKVVLMQVTFLIVIVLYWLL